MVLPRKDLLFADLVVEQGIATRAQVDECVATLRRLAETGAAPLPSLGEMLVRKGYLTSGQLERTLRPSEATPVTRSDQAPRAGDLPRPPEVEEAAADPANAVGKYVRVRLIGQGGMGEVWKAWDVHLGRWVALKFLKVADRQEIVRFRREAQTAARLSHSNIAALYEAEDRFIAMQFIDGPTLSAFPRDNPRRLVKIIRQAALAVHHAHEQGIIHRDLKPANIMVEQAGHSESGSGRDRVFVMDFGLAKSMSVDPALSASGTIVGTPAYMSPEQARGGNSVDHRADVYSLGATLYELLTDAAPFRAAEVYDILRKVVEEEPRPIRHFKPAVDRDLETIVMKCLEKDPARRYANALAVADDLTRWLEGEPIQARPPSLGYRLRKKYAKKKPLVAVSALLALSGLALVGYVLFQAGVRSAERRESRGKFDEAERATDPATRLSLYRQAAKHIPEARVRADEMEQRIREETARAEARSAHAGEYQKGLDLWSTAVVQARAGDASQARIRAQDARRRFEAANEYVEQPMALVMIGRCLRIEGREGATQAWEHALRLDGACSAARLDLAKSLLTRYHESRGLPEVWVLDEQLIIKDLSPETPAQAALRDRAERELAVLQREGVQAALLEGLLLLGRGEYPAAAAQLALYTREESWDIDGWDLLAKALYSGRDFARSVEALSRSIALVPAAGRFVMRGLARAALKQTSAAVADYAEAIRLDAGYALAYYNRGNSRHGAGDLTGALEDWAKAIQLEPDYPSAYYSRARARMMAGEYDRAISDYDRVIELSPKFATAYYNRATARAARGEYRKAIEDYTTAIELNPKYAAAYVNRGNSHEALGDADKAISDYTRALEIDRNQLEALVNRGVQFVVKKRYTEAIDDLTRAPVLDPRHVKAHYSRGTARYLGGDPEGGMADYTHAIDFDPRHGDAHVCRGLARETLVQGHPAREKELLTAAEKDLAKGLELGSSLAATTERALARVRARLKELGP